MIWFTDIIEKREDGTYVCIDRETGYPYQATPSYCPERWEILQAYLAEHPDITFPHTVEV